MDYYLLIKFLHIIGAAVLIGTGTGIAFFMFAANKTRDIKTIAATSKIVVTADYIFTLSAAIVQPITGLILTTLTNRDLFEGWIAVSLLLYVFIGALWVPVIFIQKKMSVLANQAAIENSKLPQNYHQLYKIWFWCGVPAFGAIILLLWLMIAKPNIF